MHVQHKGGDELEVDRAGGDLAARIVCGPVAVRIVSASLVIIVSVGGIVVVVVLVVGVVVPFSSVAVVVVIVLLLLIKVRLLGLVYRLVVDGVRAGDGGDEEHEESPWNEPLESGELSDNLAHVDLHRQRQEAQGEAVRPNDRVSGAARHEFDGMRAHDMHEDNVHAVAEYVKDEETEGNCLEDPDDSQHLPGRQYQTHKVTDVPNQVSPTAGVVDGDIGVFRQEPVV